MLPPDHAPVRLQVSFDWVQRSKRLMWRFTKDALGLYAHDGPHAGAVLLHPGDRVAVDVLGLHDGVMCPAIQIVSAALLFMPRTVMPRHDEAQDTQGEGEKPPLFYPASPFDPRSSSTLLTEFHACGEGNHVSCKTLHVEAAAGGAWEMSMMLSALRHGEPRTFRFDPEVEIGNGSRNTPRR
jgi:hypothetical protein